MTNYGRQSWAPLIRRMFGARSIIAGTGLAGGGDLSVNRTLSLVGGVPRWTKYPVTYQQLATAGLTNDIELFSLPAKSVIHATCIKHSTTFLGGLITGYQLSVGITGNLVKYSVGYSVFDAVAGNSFLLSSTTGMESHTIATSIRVAAISATGLLNTASQGAADIWVLTSTLA